jgi:mRNA interferase MazF
MNIERGDILLIGFDPTKGSEIQKTRPAVVVTNNVANKFSKLLTVVPITSQKIDTIRVFESLIKVAEGLKKQSKAVISQMRAIDRSRIQKKIGKISKADLKSIDKTIKIHLGLK